MEDKNIGNIIIFTAAGIGNFIWETSAVSLVKQYNKNIKITLIMCEEYVSLVDKNLHVDNIITLKHKYHKVETPAIYRWIYKLFWTIKNYKNLYKKNCCIILDNSKSFFISAKYLYKIKNIYIFSNNIQENNKLHAMLKYQILIRSVFPTYNLSIPILPDTTYLEKHLKQEFLQNTNKYKIALCTKSSANIRDWNINNFNELIKKINLYFKSTFFILGSSKDEELNGNFLQELNKDIDLRNLCGKTSLLEVKEILKNMDLLISVDTSIVHLAAVNNIPTISFYGFSTPENSIGINHNFIAMYTKEECSPCDKKYHTKKLLCKNPKCIEKITPDMVFENIKNILNNKQNEKNN